jgi:hypothetical protein
MSYTYGVRRLIILALCLALTSNCFAMSETLKKTIFIAGSLGGIVAIAYGTQPKEKSKTPIYTRMYVPVNGQYQWISQFDGYATEYCNTSDTAIIAGATSILLGIGTVVYFDSQKNMAKVQVKF